MSFLSDEIRERINAYIPRYPNKQAVTLPALHIVHDELRCVPNEAIREIADLLDLAPAEVIDTMTFYQFFREPENKLGKTRVWVCRTLACALRGADDLLEHCSKKLGVPVGGTTSDGKITLEFAECIGACEGAPAVLVNDEHVMNMTNDKVDTLIAELQAK
jgi:NADH-quinone oxidoreductase subunit E